MTDYPWRWAEENTGGRFSDLEELNVELRTWASSSRQLAAGVELLIRSGHSQPHFDWVVIQTSGSRIDFEATTRRNYTLSNAQESLLRIAASIATGTPVSLHKVLPELDYAEMALVLRAIVSASGYGEPTPFVIKDFDAPPPTFPVDDAAPYPWWRPPLSP